jgi:hypothetical protein
LSTLTYSGVLTIKNCWCGMRHAIPQDLALAADRDRSISVYCPVGHEWVSGAHERRESEKLREQLEDERRRACATRDLLAHEERSHAATRGHLTRQKKRAAAGVCPCCNRTFQQLARHMKSKHPGFTPEDVSPAIGTAS